MQRTTALLTVLIAAGAAVPARAASTLVIRGAGFGHGVGMSQYGADGYALHGKDYRYILAHYYSGTSLGQTSPSQTIRVLLKTGKSASFSGATNAGGRKLDPAQTYSVAETGIGQIALRSPTGRTMKTFSPPLRVTGNGPLTLRGTAQNGLRDGSYRGALEFRPTAFGTIQTVNALALETYVRGVVGAESPPSWPAAALEAQAVAARTYAITTGGGNAGFDQYADTRSQMYRGIAVETPSTDAAVANTAGQVVTYQGKPVVTYFFSTSGGRTEDVQNSFIGSPPQPWLVSVKDPYDGVSPRHRWTIRMSMRSAAAKLHGLVKGTFKGISVVQRGASPRIVYADVVGSGGRTRVTGPTLRARFGLFDTWASFSVISASGKKVGPPSSSAPSAPSGSQPCDGGAPSGGSGPCPGAGSSSGGTGGDPSGGARAAAVAIAGDVVGRVGPHGTHEQVELQRIAGGAWQHVAWERTDRRGRFRFADLHHGAYRVLWRGAAGPSVVL